MSGFLQTFQFEVKLRRSAEIVSGSGSTTAATRVNPNGDALGDGGFQECSGLEIEMDVQEHVEGGRNTGIIKRIGRARFQNIALKRGMLYGDDGNVNADLWKWLQDVVTGVRPARRYDGLIEVRCFQKAGSIVESHVAATWSFFRGLPAKITGPQLNAKTGDIAIEELHIAHEGLKLEI